MKTGSGERDNECDLLRRKLMLNASGASESQAIGLILSGRFNLFNFTTPERFLEVHRSAFIAGFGIAENENRYVLNQAYSQARITFTKRVTSLSSFSILITLEATFLS